MFPVPASFDYVVYPEFAVFALFISGVSGVLVSMILKFRVRGTAMAKDAFLGAAASVITVYVLGHLGFDYSFVTAILVAVLLPALHEFYRYKHMRVGAR
jgi:hypothetical protein